MKEIFKSERERLDGILQKAVGAADGTNELPDLVSIVSIAEIALQLTTTKAGDYKNNIAKFYVDGRFLLQGNIIKDYFSKGYELLNKKLVGTLHI